jgi:hypothetical protein
MTTPRNRPATAADRPDLPLCSGVIATSICRDAPGAARAD